MKTIYDTALLVLFSLSTVFVTLTFCQFLEHKNPTSHSVVASTKVEENTVLDSKVFIPENKKPKKQTVDKHYYGR